MPELGPFPDLALWPPQLEKPVVLHGYLLCFWTLIPGNSELCRIRVAG